MMIKTIINLVLFENDENPINEFEFLNQLPWKEKELLN